MFSRRIFLERILKTAAATALAPLVRYVPSQPDLRSIGFSIREELGFLVFNPTGVQRLTVSTGKPYTL